ncbi:MAG TPA: NAD(P)H-dependent oxidoreductase [Pedobacter sp.]|nr:NAD(P)H-dependent oxidoreductase [Pedobacter sp.]
MHIVILSASVRLNRNSHRVALYFHDFITAQSLATVEIVDLTSYNFPIFDERLQYMPDPEENVLDFQQKINGADGVLLVTPEYNGGYPASLKNVIDLLYKEWQRKPIALATVSAGPFGGAQVMTSLVFCLWKIGAWVVPAMFPVPQVQNNYDEKGIPKDKESTDKRAQKFLGELIWCITAKSKMQ